MNLVGYCDERDHLALIYEFVPNGDLRQHLSGKLEFLHDSKIYLDYIYKFQGSEGSKESNIQENAVGPLTSGAIGYE